MARKNLTTAALEVIAPQDDDRTFMLSAGEFSTATTVYIRLGQMGIADIALYSTGNTTITIKLPAKLSLMAWTNAGTAKLCLVELQ